MPHDPDLIQDIFDQAAELLSSEWEAYLDEKCHGDAVLKAKIQSWLAKLKERPTVEGEALSQQLGPYAPGDRLGQYTITEQLGAGGFGVVYQARQDNPSRDVAIKVIRPEYSGRDSKFLERFKAEQEALARLEHPHIATLYTCGEDDEARPYIVMQYIDGDPLDTVCDLYKLDIEERLRIAAEVCDAVSHAHSKGLIHRDLKPGNILLSLNSDDGKWHPTVIDFGIAKAIEIPLSAQELSQDGRAIGTYGYMSPEQADGDLKRIDTRTDVYALGVILYKLLAGRLPLEQAELDERGDQAKKKMIREVDPPRPGRWLKTSSGERGQRIARERSTEIGELSRRLSRELEHIPMRALRKEPAERYDSAKTMGDDIRRYLKGERLVAGPDSAAYRLRKSIRRNKGAYSAVAAIILALIAGVVVSLMFAFDAQHQRAVAQDEAAEADRQRQVAQENESEVMVQEARAREAKSRADRLAFDGRMALAASTAKSDPRYSNEYLRHASSIAFDEDNPPLGWQVLKAQVDQSSQLDVPKKWRKEFPRIGTRTKPFVDGFGMNYFSTLSHEIAVSLCHNMSADESERSQVIIRTPGDLSGGNLGIIRTLSRRPTKAGPRSASWTAGDESVMVLRGQDGRGGNTVVECWDPATGELLWESELGQVSSRNGPRFSSDGLLLAALKEKEERIEIWDTRQGRLRHVLSGGPGKKTYAFDPNNKFLASGSTGGQVRLWNLDTGELMWTLSAVGGAIIDIAFHVDGDRFITVTEAGLEQIWYATSAEPLDVDLALQAIGVGSSGDDLQRLAGVHVVEAILESSGFVPINPGQVKSDMLDPVGFHYIKITQEQFKPRDKKESALNLIYNPRIIRPKRQPNSTLEIRSALTGEIFKSKKINESSLKAFAFSPDKKRLAIAQPPIAQVTPADRVMKEHIPGMALVPKPYGSWAIHVLDLETNEWINQFDMQPIDPKVFSSDAPRAIQYSPDGSMIAVSADARNPSQKIAVVYILDSETGDIIHEYTKKTEPQGNFREMTWDSYSFGNLAYSPDGTTLALVDSNNDILFIEVGGRGFSPERARCAEVVESFGFTPDGKNLVAVTSDRYLGWRTEFDSIWETDERDLVLDVARGEQDQVVYTCAPWQRWENNRAGLEQLKAIATEVDGWIERFPGDHQQVVALLEEELARRSPREGKMLRNVVIIKLAEQRKRRDQSAVVP